MSGEWSFDTLRCQSHRAGIEQQSTGLLHYIVRISHSQKMRPPIWWPHFLAESVRFELTVGRPITSFQDWLLKPLGQLSL